MEAALIILGATAGVPMGFAFGIVFAVNLLRRTGFHGWPD
jgi:hypothetical protein